MIVAGRVVMKMLPVLQRIWQQMHEPKWCISMGACASTGGVFDTYCVVQGIDRFIPVDMYVPGCPPRPEQLIQAIIDLQEKIQREGTIDGPRVRDRIAPGAEAGAGRIAGDYAAAWREPIAAGRDRVELTQARTSCRARWTGACRCRMTAPEDHRRRCAKLSRPCGCERVPRQTPGRRAARAVWPSVFACYLKDERGFDLLVDVTCVDYLNYRDADDRFGLVYLLANTDTNERLTVRVFLNDPDPTVPSAVPLWEGANWLEREVCDMFGIAFDGPSRPAADPAARGVHGLPAAQGLSAAGPRRAAQFPGAVSRRRLAKARLMSTSMSHSPKSTSNRSQTWPMPRPATTCGR